MLRLSKKADYALMAVRHLALAPERGAASARAGTGSSAGQAVPVALHPHS
jgi:DNA-binding IscR family transcriptional regulator